MTDPATLARIREALRAAGYSVDGVLEMLGPAAYAALGRGETVPALRVTADDGPRATLIRLFLLQVPVSTAQAARALPVAEAEAAGLLVRDGDEVRARLDVRPYAADESDWWVVSDLTPGIGGVGGPVAPDHVVGVGGSSTTLAQVTVRPPVGTSLDLGTGCGVQALHLSRHTARVTATDVNPRALGCARLTAGLSETRLELMEGDRFAPVAGRRFDLVVSNPPFVVAPVGGGLVYRDSGLPGDELCRRLVAEAPSHLADGGWFQMLGNWLHVRGEDWRERLAAWVRPTGCDAWVVQRDVQDPAAYVETWLRDAGEPAGPAYDARYEAWLAALEDAKVEGIGFGWLALRCAGHDAPLLRIEEVTRPVDQPLGAHVLDWFARHDWLRRTDDAALLAARLTADASVRLEEVARRSPAGWELESRRLRLDSGMRTGGVIDAMGASVVAACDGRRKIAEVLDAVAAEHELDPVGVRDGAVAAVRGLVEEGFLRPSP